MSDYCPVFSGPGAKLQAHGPVFYYQQSRRDQLPTTGRRWNRGAVHHSGAVPYVRQDNARRRYTYRWPSGCPCCLQSDTALYRALLQIVGGDKLIIPFY